MKIPTTPATLSRTCLQTIAVQIDATTKSIQTAQRVVAAVSEVVAVAAQVMALIA